MAVAKSSLQYTGVQAINPPELQFAQRAPSSADRAFQKGTIWVDLAGAASYQWPGSGNWIALGSGTSGAIVTLTGDTGGAISPVGGNISILGTAAQGLSFAGSAGTLTGTIADWTTAQKGVGILSSNAQAVTGTGTTQAVTPAALTARLQSPGAIGGTLAAAGSFTTLASSGDYTNSAGNVIINGAAKQLRVHGGAATDFVGSVTLASGTSGAIANTNIAATDRIIPFRISINASTAIGVGFSYSIIDSTSFTILSLDASAATETDDNSIIGYFIYRQV